MIFHWSLSDSKSPQVPRILLSILAVLNNVVVWMLSTRPLISTSSSPFYCLLLNVPKAPITIGVIVTYMFDSKVELFVLLFVFFHFYSVVSRYSEAHNFGDYKNAWSSGRDLVIRLYVKIQWGFKCLILRYRCSVQNIPFVRIVRFEFLAKFPVDHLAHPVVSSLIPLLCYYHNYYCYYY